MAYREDYNKWHKNLFNTISSEKFTKNKLDLGIVFCEGIIRWKEKDDEITLYQDDFIKLALALCEMEYGEPFDNINPTVASKNSAMIRDIAYVHFWEPVEFDISYAYSFKGLLEQLKIDGYRIDYKKLFQPVCDRKSRLELLRKEYNAEDEYSEGIDFDDYCDNDDYRNDDYDNDKYPDWLGGIETEEEYWSIQSSIVYKKMSSSMKLGIFIVF